MTTLKRCIEFLEAGRIRYAHTRHSIAYTAREVAAAEHLSAHKLTKIVVFLSENGFGLALVPGDYLVHLEVLRSLQSVNWIRLATEQEIAELFPECELGAMPAFGNLFDLPVYVDSGVSSQEFIAFNAGTHRDVIHMSFADFRHVVDPRIATFAYKEIEEFA